jgi:RNA polymerase sigma-70 factor (ECF subfamily)
VKQREVIVLRDVAGLEADEVCRLLSISAENQRVRLHRGRAAVRKMLEAYMR